jgi:hypothetical protein
MIVPRSGTHNPLPGPAQRPLAQRDFAAQTAKVTDEIVGGRQPLGAAAPEPGRGGVAAWPSGPELPRPGGSRLGPKVALLAVAGLLFGYAGTHRYAEPPTEKLAVPLSRPIAAHPALPWLGGRVGAGPPGLRLLVGDRSPRLVDAGTGRVTVPPGLGAAAGTVLSVFPLNGSVLAAVTEPYGGYGGRFLVRPGAQPVLLGADPSVLPSRDGQLVLTSYRRGSTTVTGLTVDRRLRWQWQLPGLLVPVRDTPAGLLAQQYDGPQGRDADLLLVDRGTGAVRRRIGHGSVAASSAGAVAWTPADCPARCALRVTQLATGVTQRYAMPIYWVPDRGAFSPDGRTLALTFPASGQIGISRPGFVVTLDLQLSAFTRVRDLRTGSDLGAEVDWSPDGRWLVIAVNWPDQQRIALWQPGQLRVLPVVLPGRPGPLTVLH